MKAKRLSLHILFWLLYLLFQTYIEFAWISSSYAHLSVGARWLIALAGEASFLPVKIPLSYFILHLVKRLAGWQRPQPVRLAVLAFKALLACAIAVILHRVLILFFILPMIYGEDPGDEKLLALQRLVSAVLDILFIVGMVVAAGQYRQYRRIREQEKLLQREKLESELKFLRAQINPHFLFNTLNNIYGLARKRSELTADVVMRLSKLLRFMLYESREPLIPVAEEIRVLKDYIALEQIRYNDRLELKWEEEVDDPSQPISPLILLPFVENAFKHGASESRFAVAVHIRIRVANRQLWFHCENGKEEQEGMLQENRIGLGNSRRQLELLYPGHQLEIRDGKQRFSVELRLNLESYAAL